jgi:phage-related protein
MMDILYYADGRGIQEVYDWEQHIKKHEPATYNRFYYLKVLLEENGELIQAGKIKPPTGVKRLKGTDDIWQIRINDNRVLFFYFANKAIVLTNQFKKKQNDTPQNEIDRAENRKEQWLNNNRNQ